MRLNVNGIIAANAVQSIKAPKFSMKAETKMLKTSRTPVFTIGETINPITNAGKDAHDMSLKAFSDNAKAYPLPSLLRSSETYFMTALFNVSNERVLKRVITMRRREKDPTSSGFRTLATITQNIEATA